MLDLTRWKREHVVLAWASTQDVAVYVTLEQKIGTSIVHLSSKLIG